MGKLSESEVKEIIQKANLLKRFKESSSSVVVEKSNTELERIFEITDDMGLDRSLVYEAYLEFESVSTSEPLILDTQNFGTTESFGMAAGKISPELLSELKAHLEYHFNNKGEMVNRKDKFIWKARPGGLSRIFSSSSNIEVQFQSEGNNTKIFSKRSMSTINKFFAIPILGTLAGLLFISGSMFTRSNSDAIPFLIIGTLITLFSAGVAKFIFGRRKKFKHNLKDLTESLQGIIERKFKASFQQNSFSPKISILDQEEEEVKTGSRNSLRNSLKG